jgi:hypothetical protein
MLKVMHHAMKTVVEIILCFSNNFSYAAYRTAKDKFFARKIMYQNTGIQLAQKDFDL